MIGGLAQRADKYRKLEDILDTLQECLAIRAEGDKEPATADDQQPREMVKHPDHYGGDTVYETIKVLEAWMTPEQYIGFLRGSVHRYTSRAGKKDPAKLIEDLEKAITYLQFEIDFRKRNNMESVL